MSAPIVSALVTVSNDSEATSVSISYTSSYYQRVAAIATEVAYAVCREQDGGATIVGHTNRAARAIQWLAQCSTASYQIAMAIVVTSDNTTNDSSTSQQIADRIAAIWDTLSGN